MDKISAVVITKNEENNIERCLKSLNWVDEIIVYDSGSVDKTIDLAKKLGAKTFEGNWLGFGPTKKKATDLASHDWILSIDADEVVTETLKIEIQSKLKHDNVNKGYLIPRLSFYLKTWIKHGGWYPDYQLRLFNRTQSQWNDELIHEKVISPTNEKLSSDLHHYVFKNIEHQVATNNRYSSLQAEKMADQKIKMNHFHLWTKPSVKFIECYILKAGFLDGWAGFLIAKNASYSVFLKWVKLKEHYENSK